MWKVSAELWCVVLTISTVTMYISPPSVAMVLRLLTCLVVTPVSRWERHIGRRDGPSTTLKVSNSARGRVGRTSWRNRWMKDAGLMATWRSARWPATSTLPQARASNSTMCMVSQRVLYCAWWASVCCTVHDEPVCFAVVSQRVLYCVCCTVHVHGGLVCAVV